MKTCMRAPGKNLSLCPAVRFVSGVSVRDGTRSGPPALRRYPGLSDQGGARLRLMEARHPGSRLLVIRQHGIQYLVHSSVAGRLFCPMIGRFSQSSRQRRERHPSAKEVQVRFEWWTNRNTLLNVRGLTTVLAASDLLRDVICIGDARLLPRFDSVMAQASQS
jgi:hypothetical protein